MAFALREIGPDSVPVNFLTPVKGTRLGVQKLLGPFDALKIISLYRHLFEICARTRPSYLIQGVVDINRLWITGLTCVGLTAGASTPDSVIDEVEAWLVARP